MDYWKVWFTGLTTQQIHMAEDGEIESSDSEEETPVKKPKVEENEDDKAPLDAASQKDDDDDDDDDEWSVVVKGPMRRKMSQEQTGVGKKKKKRKRQLIQYDREVIDTTHKTSQSFMNAPQKLLIQALHQLMGKKQVYDCPHQFKTSDLQVIIRHLTIGKPEISKKMRLHKRNPIGKKKILVVWLSCVSKIDFQSSKTNFQQLKALLPQLQFKITHPGSDRFVHFGLESFMELEDQSQQRPLPAKFKVPLEHFSRHHCLLTYNELVENGYPIPSSNDQDVTTESSEVLSPDYIMITPWPYISSHMEIDVSNFPLFAVDCEMVKTEFALELARVTIINENLDCIYDSLVKPDNPVIDYLTKYSGVNESMLKDVTTTMRDVHAKLREVLPAECILVGHSLENDLIALKLYHPYIVDTSLLFTPHATPRYKPSLKNLTKKLLNREIQNAGSKGHDSVEDAIACMDLINKKLKFGPKLFIPWNDYKMWLPVLLSTHDIVNTLVDKQSLTNLYGNHKQVYTEVVVSDEDAIEKAAQSLTKSMFVFVQLHMMEEYLKQEEKTETMLKSTIDSLDALVCKLIASSPQNSLIFVVCGSSYIKEVRQLQQDPNTDSQVLKTAVMTAREGMVLATLK